jgi:hypothetical protein
MPAVADINSTNYFGGPRHSPRPEFSNAEYFGDDEKPVARLSVTETEVNGTGGLVSGVHKPKRAGAVHGTYSMPGIEGPLDTSAHGEIIEASGLGKKIASPGKEEDQDDEDQDDEDQEPQQRRPGAPDPANPISTGNLGDPYNPHPLSSTIRTQGMGRPSVVGRNFLSEPL